MTRQGNQGLKLRQEFLLRCIHKSFKAKVACIESSGMVAVCQFCEESDDVLAEESIFILRSICDISNRTK